MATRLPYEEFKSIYSKVPRLCLELVVRNPEGFLLTLRDIPPYKGFWHLPGGTLLLDETLEESLQRIASEEIGTKVKVKKVLGYIDWPVTKLALGHTVSLLFLVEPNGKIKLDYQASDYKYFKKFPENTIKEHADFLLDKLIKILL